jgi:hypothetical protein
LMLQHMMAFLKVYPQLATEYAIESPIQYNLNLSILLQVCNNFRENLLFTTLHSCGSSMAQVSYLYPMYFESTLGRIQSKLDSFGCWRCCP